METLEKIKSKEWTSAEIKTELPNVKNPKAHIELISGIFESYEKIKEKIESSKSLFHCVRKFIAREDEKPIFLFEYEYVSNYSKSFINLKTYSNQEEKAKRINLDLINGINKIHKSLNEVREYFAKCPHCGRVFRFQYSENEKPEKIICDFCRAPLTKLRPV